ncbi:MAG: protein kinase family protein [Planctomycetota bacterium]
MVYLLELDEGRRAVIKDFLPCPFFWRWTYGRYLTWRECTAYERLDGVEGVPPYLGRLDAYAFAVEWVPGKDLGKCPKGSLGVKTFDNLRRTVEAMHARGVIHLDLRQRRNVLVDEDGVARVIDYSSGFTVNPKGMLGRFLLRRFTPIDLSGVLKYKRRFLPDALTDDEKAELRRVERFRKWWPFS